MQAFTYHSPTKIIFGNQTHYKAADCICELGINRVLIVYGSERIIKNGLLEQVTDGLDTAGIGWKLFGGTVANPRLSHAREGVKTAIAFEAGLILAIGGGSVIDTAKIIAAGAANPCADIWDFWSGKQLLTHVLPIGVILTIAAAGSETSNSAVITNDETYEKRGITNELQRPVFAIMNPELSYSLPRKQIAAGITDIMMHTMERYFVPWQGNHLSDAIAEGLLCTMIKYGPLALENSQNYEAMSEIMWCGSVSHIDFVGLGGGPPQGGRLGDWATHQLGHEIGGMFDCTHGETLSAVWASWANYVCKTDYTRFAQFGRNVWKIYGKNDRDTAEETIRMTVQFFKDIQMPTCFTELGIGLLSVGTIETLAKNCSFQKMRSIGSFKILGYEEILEIYSAANY